MVDDEHRVRQSLLNILASVLEAISDGSSVNLFNGSSKELFLFPSYSFRSSGIPPEWCSYITMADIPRVSVEDIFLFLAALWIEKLLSNHNRHT